MNSTIAFNRLPGGSRLFLDYLYDPRHVGAFFPWPFRSGREFDSCSRLLDGQTYNRSTLIEILRRQNTDFGVDPAVLANIERLHDARTLVVCTGQQVGLYGGSMYTVYKALGAIGHARRLAEKLQRPVVSVFWLAADDHDFAEVRWTACPTSDNHVQRVMYEPAIEPERIPTAQIILDENIKNVHATVQGLRLATEFSADVDTALDECYRPGVSLATAFGR